MVSTLIIGKGDMALGLCRQFGRHNTNKGLISDDEETVASPTTGKQQQHFLQVASRGGNHETLESFQETGVNFVDMEDGIIDSDVIILAIPSAAVKDFIFQNMEAIKDKIIVDIANPTKKGQNVQSALEEIYKNHGIDYDIHWVKAFNDVGALDLLTRKATSKKPLTTMMCGNDEEAVDTVKFFAQQALAFERVTVLPGANFVSDMEDSQGTLGWEWIHTFWIMLFIHTAAFAYVAVHSHKGDGTSTDVMPACTMNRAFASTSLTGFAFTQMPGIYANGLRTFGGRGAPFPKWLQWSLAIRKHMGLASFFALSMHAIMSCLLFSQLKKPSMFNKVTGRLFLYPELSFLFACLGFCCYACCAIASLPSVGAAMNFKQWDFVFGKFIWLSLAMGTIHPVLLGVKSWDSEESRPLGMASPTLMSSVLPLTVMAAKIVQVLICAAQRELQRSSRRSWYEQAMKRASFTSLKGSKTCEFSESLSDSSVHSNYSC